MKKIILCLSVLLFCFNIYAKGKNKENLNLDYGCPQIESSNYYFIDLNEYQNNLINSIEILFYANNENSITIFGNNPENKDWENLIQFDIKGFSDKQKKVFVNKNAINWRYFYIQPDKGVVYKYKISFNGKTLRCEIRGKNDNFEDKPLPKINIENSFVFDISEYDAEDYVIFQNYTNNKEMKVIPYYFDRKTKKWCRSFEIAYLKGFADTQKIEIIDDEGIEDIKYLAIEINPFENYNFKVYENHSDLYIEISDNKTGNSNIVNKNDINYIDE